MSAKDQDRLLGHAQDNDGIDEYDNALPTWWLGILWGSIAFAIVYVVDYHFVSDRSQVATYEAEVAAAPQASSASAAPLVITPEVLAAGKAVYDANCMACHGPELKGSVGPDLVDATWIHGGTLAQITETITKGVPEKGMLTWGPILGPEKVAQVAAFVHGAGGGQ
ncbi:MAG: c-type cytochrome [Pseudomonadota bacterium]|nr:c-type cytochrome [Pseudomonadota bacterium]